VICQAPLALEPRCADCGAAQRPGGFRVQRLLAQRPHGRVYLAADGAGQQVVIKELLFHLAPDAQTVDALERECELLRSCRLPGVPRVLDLFSEGSGVHLRLYQVQEYIAGRSLRALVEQGPLSDHTVAKIARQALVILNGLHQHQPPIVHRDLKPENLIQREDGSLALVDFGAARTLAQGETHGATLVGTFGYMSPEQLGGTVSPASDLYGLGATLLHLLTGRPPLDFLHEGLELRFTGAVSPRWRAFLQGLLARTAGKRFPSAKAALAALEKGEGAPRTGGRRWLLAGALAVAVTLLTTGLVAALPQGAPARAQVPIQLEPSREASVDALFAQLASTQVDSARLSVLYELLYSNQLQGHALTADQRTLLESLRQSASPEIQEKATQLLSRAGDLGASAERFDALVAQAKDPARSTSDRAKAAAAAGTLLVSLPQNPRSAARAEALVDLMLTAPDADIRAYAGYQLPHVHPLSSATLARIQKAYLEAKGPAGQLLAALISHVADLHLGEPEALAMTRSHNSHERHLGVVALSALPLTPAALTALAHLGRSDPSDEVRTDARLVLDRAAR
jgi:serine/threonine protein kinase